MKYIPLEKIDLCWHQKAYSDPLRRILEALSASRPGAESLILKIHGSTIPTAAQTDTSRQFFKVLADFDAEHPIVMARPDQQAQLIHDVRTQGEPLLSCDERAACYDVLAQIFNYREFYAGYGFDLSKSTSAEIDVHWKSSWMTDDDLSDKSVAEIEAMGLRRWRAWEFIQSLRTHPEARLLKCPYCNEAPIRAAEYDLSGSLLHTESDLDHYFDKTRYPYLALSIYNLIPVCSVCNGPSYKHTQDFAGAKDARKMPYAHPYCDDVDTEVSFAYPKDRIGEALVASDQLIPMELIPRQGTDGVRAKSLLDVFKVRDRYLDDFKEDMRLIPVRLQMAKSTWPDDTMALLRIGEASKRICNLFGCSFDRSKINSERLAKVTNDLVLQLGRINVKLLVDRMSAGRLGGCVCRPRWDR